MALVKFKQGLQNKAPSYEEGSLLATTDTHNLYLDSTGSGRTLVGTASESFLKWGGQNLSSNFSPIDAALAGELGANRLAFLPPGRVKLEYSRDAGETWTELDDEEKKTDCLAKRPSEILYW